MVQITLYKSYIEPIALIKIAMYKMTQPVAVTTDTAYGHSQ